MKEKNSAAAKGLRLICLGQIILIVSCLLAFIEALGPVVTILSLAAEAAGMVLSLVGMKTALAAHEGFRMAMVLTLIALVCGLLTVMGGWVFLLLRAISAVVSYMAMAYVCDSTAQLCGNRPAILELEDKARKLYLGLVALVVLCQGLSLVNVLSDMGGFMNLFSRVAQIIALFYYMHFLTVARKELEG